MYLWTLYNMKLFNSGFCEILENHIKRWLPNSPPKLKLHEQKGKKQTQDTEWDQF